MANQSDVISVAFSNGAQENGSVCIVMNKLLNCVNGTASCKSQVPQDQLENMNRLIGQLNCSINESLSADECTTCMDEFIDKNVNGSLGNESEALTCANIETLTACIENKDGCDNQLSPNLRETLASTVERANCEMMVLNVLNETNMTDASGLAACTGCVHKYSSQIASIDLPNEQLQSYVCETRNEFIECLKSNDQCKNIIPSSVIQEAEGHMRKINCESNNNSSSVATPEEAKACEACVSNLLNGMGRLDYNDEKARLTICSTAKEFLDCLDRNLKCKELAPPITFDNLKTSMKYARCDEGNITNTSDAFNPNECHKCIEEYSREMSTMSLRDTSDSAKTCSLVQRFLDCLEKSGKCKSIIPDSVKETAYNMLRQAGCNVTDLQPEVATASGISQRNICETCFRDYSYKISHSNRRLGPSEMCKAGREFLACIERSNCEHVLPASILDNVRRTATQMNCDVDVHLEPEVEVTTTSGISQRNRCETCYRNYSYKISHSNRRLEPAEMCKAGREFLTCAELSKCGQILPPSMINNVRKTVRQMNCDVDVSEVQPKSEPEPKPTMETAHEVQCEGCMRNFQARIDRIDYSNNRVARMQICSAGEQFLHCVQQTSDCSKYGKLRIVDHAQKNLERLRCERITKPKDSKLQSCEECARELVRKFSGPADHCRAVDDFYACIGRNEQCKVAQYSAIYRRAEAQAQSLQDCGWVPHPVRPTVPTKPEKTKTEACEECAREFLLKFRARQDPCKVIQEFNICISRYDRCNGIQGQFQIALTQSRTIADCGWKPVRPVRPPTIPSTLESCEECGREMMNKIRASYGDCRAVDEFKSCIGRHRGCSNVGQLTAGFQQALQRSQSLQDCGWVPPPPTESPKLRSCEACGKEMMDKIRASYGDCKAVDEFKICIGRHSGCSNVGQLSAGFQQALQRSQSLQDCGWVPPPPTESPKLRSCEACGKEMMDKIRASYGDCKAVDEFKICIGRFSGCSNVGQLSAGFQQALQRSQSLQDCGWVPPPQMESPKLRSCEACGKEMMDKIRASYGDCKAVDEFKSCIGRHSGCSNVGQLSARFQHALQRSQSLQDCGWVPNPPTPKPPQPTTTPAPPAPSTCTQCSNDFYQKTREISLSKDRKQAKILMCECSTKYLTCINQNGCSTDGQAANFVKYATQVVSRFKCNSTSVEPPRRTSQCLQCALNHQNQMRGIDMSDKSGSKIQVCTMAENFYQCVGRYNDCVDPEINRIVEETDRNVQYFSCSGGGSSATITGGGGTTDGGQGKTTCTNCIRDYSQSYRQIDFSNRSTVREKTCLVVDTFMSCIKGKNECEQIGSFNQVLKQVDMTAKHLRC